MHRIISMRVVSDRSIRTKKKNKHAINAREEECLYGMVGVFFRYRKKKTDDCLLSGGASKIKFLCFNIAVSYLVHPC